MQNSTRALMNYPKKNRMVFKLYWICTICVICLQILYFVYFYVTDSFADKSITTPEYTKMFIIVPSAIYVVLGLVLFFIIRRLGESAPVAVTGFMMAGTVIFVNVIVYTHYGVAVIYVSYIFPIILSLFYNNRKLTLTTSFFVLISYIVIVTTYLPAREQEFVRHNITDIAAMLAIIILTTLSGMHILDIYSDLIDKIVEQTIKKIALEREAKEDSLTKLYNHAVFYESLDLAVNSFEEISTPFCIIVMDLDNFKSVNDTYGHAFGDIVLLNFADTIRSHLNEQDMAFRYGGEEFSIISFRPLADTMLLAEDIRKSFSEVTLLEHPEARFTVSLGVSLYSKKYNGKREFFASADRALYTAKKQGKNCTISA